MAELSLLDSLDTETRAELDGIEKSTPDLERQIRAATAAVETEDRSAVIDAATGDKSEDGKRVELRAACSVGRYLLGAKGNQSGPEAELQQELGLAANQIPLEVFARPETRAEGELEKRVTPAPGTVGINLDVLRPAVFAASIVTRLMVEMPMVESGTYATGTITTSVTADAVAKGADVPETDGAFTVATTTPHRVGASLNLAAEDLAAVGQQNFEALLRQHISLVLSAELDDQLLNGDGANDDLLGVFNRIGTTSLTTPGSAVADFDDYIAAFVAGIDGLWATESSQVGIVAGVDTYKIAAAAFRDIAAADLGDTAFDAYARANFGGFWTNSRMPAAASNIQSGILTRRGQSMMPDPMRVAVCPHWGYLSVDDIFTGARRAERRYVLSVLVGDVILVQPAAYGLVTFRTST